MTKKEFLKKYCNHPNAGVDLEILIASEVAKYLGERQDRLNGYNTSNERRKTE